MIHSLARRAGLAGCRRFAVCALALLLLLTVGCRKTAEESKSKDVGGGGFWLMQSCRTLLYEFDKNAPLYLDSLRDVSRQCGSALLFAPPEKDAPIPTIYRGQSSMAVALPELPPNVTHEDFVGDCWGRMLYAERSRTFLEGIQKEWSNKGCEREAALAQPIHIVDYPGCRAGCTSQKNGCYTCQYRGGSPKGIAVLDFDGHITCQSENDARQAVRDWGRFVGVDSFDPALLECHNAELGTDLSGAAGTQMSDKIEHSASVSVTTYAKVSGNVPGVVKAEGRVSVQTGAEMMINIVISGFSANPWVERYGKREGGSNSVLECNVRKSTFKAYGANGSVEVGLTFFGNGGGGGVEIKADGKTTYSDIGSSFWLPAAGLTEEQMKGRCLVWATNYIKAQIENTGVVRAVERLSDALTNKRYAVDVSRTQLRYRDFDAYYQPSKVWVTFGDKSATVQYSLSYDYWFDPVSSKYEIPTAVVAPFKDDILAGRLIGVRGAKFFTDVVMPYSSGSWRLALAL